MKNKVVRLNELEIQVILESVKEYRSKKTKELVNAKIDKRIGLKVTVMYLDKVIEKLKEFDIFNYE